MAAADQREEAAYAAVLAELRSGVRDEPLMAKAYAEADGDDRKAQASYLRWRAAKLLQAAERQQRRQWTPPPPRPWYRPRWTPRSWSHPRAYDFLVIAAVAAALFLFNHDVHRAVMLGIRSLGWR
ncbi:MAG TPA: hypothetical protein VFA75_12605 [Nevskia sp.]|jgi:hypothetical protein|nr:hypothetical protein [Nevskia sp.]